MNETVLYSTENSGVSHSVPRSCLLTPGVHCETSLRVGICPIRKRRKHLRSRGTARPPRILAGLRLNRRLWPACSLCLRAFQHSGSWPNLSLTNSPTVLTASEPPRSHVASIPYGEFAPPGRPKLPSERLQWRRQGPGRNSSVLRIRMMP